MSKLTFKGFVPEDDPMFSSGPEIFSRPESKPPPTSKATTTTDVTPVRKSPVLSEDESMKAGEQVPPSGMTPEESLVDRISNRLRD